MPCFVASNAREVQNQEQYKKPLSIRCGRLVKICPGIEHACEFRFLDNLTPYLPMIFCQREEILNVPRFAFPADRICAR